MYAADVRHENSSLEQKLQSIYSLRGGPTIDLTIREPYKNLLRKLGNPHLSLPPTIHVAGTNGKGSVIAMLRAIFEQGGESVHTYTSPHLFRFNERIRLSGRHIDDNLLEDLLDEVIQANQNAPVTFFEITTAIAFLAFSRTPADICLLETGLGGRLDCTNVIENPLATIITAIGLDHTEFLGDSLQKIAGEKAGIMKTHTPCIIAPQTDESLYDLFRSHAKTIDCPIYLADRSRTLPTNMTGPHQTDNVATVLECIEHLKGQDITNDAIKAGLMNVDWPARLQKIGHGKLPESCELWFDGGHNESAAKAIAAQAKYWREKDNKPLCILLGIMKTKDPKAFIAPILPYISQITAIDIPDSPEAYESHALIKSLAPLSETITFSAETNIAEAIKKSCTAYQETGCRILVCGSLYLYQHSIAPELPR